jgi:hypothetical protein
VAIGRVRYLVAATRAHAAALCRKLDVEVLDTDLEPALDG